jgi:hypothetical protein
MVAMFGLMCCLDYKPNFKCCFKMKDVLKMPPNMAKEASQQQQQQQPVMMVQQQQPVMMIQQPVMMVQQQQPVMMMQQQQPVMMMQQQPVIQQQYVGGPAHELEMVR